MEESKEETKTSEPIKGVKSATVETAKRRRRTTAKTAKKTNESEVKTSDDADKSVSKPNVIKADQEASTEKKVDSKSSESSEGSDEKKTSSEKTEKQKAPNDEKKTEPEKEEKPKRTRTTRAAKKKVEEPKNKLYDSIRIYKAPSLNGFSKVHVNRFVTPEDTIGDFTKVSYVKPGFGKVNGYVLTKDLS